MKLSINTNDLLPKVQSVYSVVSSKPLLPILETILLQVKDNKLYLTTTDLETTISTYIDVVAEDSQPICVPAKLFHDALKQLGGIPIEINTSKANRMSIKTQFGDMKMVYQNGTDFPKQIDVDGEPYLMEQSYLHYMLNKTHSATSTDDLRPNLCGIYLNISNNKATFAATDTYILSESSINISAPHPEPKEAILPKKSAIVLRNTLSSGELKLTISTSHAKFEFSDIFITTRIVDGQYPNYKAVIPQNNPNTAIVEKDILLKAIKRIAIFGNHATNAIKLSLNDKIKISASNQDFDTEANEHVSCDFSGNPTELGLNAELLTKLLSNINSESVSIQFSEPNRPVLLIPTDNQNHTSLIMPIMI